MRAGKAVDVRWCVVFWAGVNSLWPLLALRGGVRMAISRSIRLTCVALEIRRIDVLFVGSSVCRCCGRKGS